MRNKQLNTKHKRIIELENDLSKFGYDFYLNSKNKEVLNHYIRTPVTIIKLLTEDNEIKPEDVKTIREELDSIVQVIDTINSWSYDLDDYILKHYDDYDYN